jgi:hypothetical protein
MRISTQNEVNSGKRISDNSQGSKHLLSIFKCASYDTIGQEYGGKTAGNDIYARIEYCKTLENQYHTAVTCALPMLQSAL